MDDLKNRLKTLIIQELKLSEILNENHFEITFDTPLFENHGFKLDSVDALMIVVIIQKEFGAVVKNLAHGRKILYSINTIAEFIEKNEK